MQQFSSLVTVFLIITVLSARHVTGAASDGNWGDGVGALFLGPLVFFFLVHTIFYLGTRILRGKASVASYVSTKINCLSALTTIMAAIAVV